jgi:hypothetical protein
LMYQVHLLWHWELFLSKPTHIATSRHWLPYMS